ncbi:MAG: DUF2225 domain-containing protein [Eubacteriales bacterium]|nr:DUF2225 domain-containing protein [Eubacteriales bacterium]
MGLFSGLEQFGIKVKDVDIYATPDENKPNLDGTKKTEAKPITEEECLFPKTYTCPICDGKFKSLAVRVGKLRSIGQDLDLRPLYKEVDPIKYDAIVCTHCGYASLSRYFNQVMPLQAKKLRAELKGNFEGLKSEGQKYSYDDAIMRYKMVLYSDVLGNVQNSRKAYTCLKLAWTIRGKLEREAMNISEKERKQLQEDELECIQNAYDGYILAFSNEHFPMSGMDEVTLTYLVAELAFRIGKYKEALTFLSRILTDQNVASRIKDKSLDLKERIREKVKEGQ